MSRWTRSPLLALASPVAVTEEAQSPPGCVIRRDTTPGSTFSALIRHNTFVGASPKAIDILATTGGLSTFPSWSAEIANNFIGGSPVGVSVVNTSSDLHSTVGVGNNLTENGRDLSVDQPARIEGNVSADPLFRNPAAGDFSLIPGSGCVDAGVSSSPAVSADFIGTPRPLDGNGDGLALPDIGAFELVRDADRDGVPDDGDFSGQESDARCACGVAIGCDDNCPFEPNASQADADCDGIGDDCEAARRPGGRELRRQQSDRVG